MRITQLRVLVPALVMTALASLAVANSTGPPLGRTGAPALGGDPAEPTCNAVGCHAGNPLNFNGTLAIEGAPAVYEPGESYELTVRLTTNSTASSPQRRWGFELTALSLTTGQTVGSFLSPSLRIASLGGRTYVSQDLQSLQAGTPSPVTWTFTWIAPSTDQGTVGFYAAGNAANGNFTNQGDFIYTGSATSQSPSTPVEALSWGRLKRGDWRPTP